MSALRRLGQRTCTHRRLREPVLPFLVLQAQLHCRPRPRLDMTCTLARSSHLVLASIMSLSGRPQLTVCAGSCARVSPERAPSCPSLETHLAAFPAFPSLSAASCERRSDRCAVRSKRITRSRSLARCTAHGYPMFGPEAPKLGRRSIRNETQFAKLANMSYCSPRTVRHMFARE